jgi:hypothetical protein
MLDILKVGGQLPPHSFAQALIALHFIRHPLGFALRSHAFL